MFVQVHLYHAQKLSHRLDFGSGINTEKRARRNPTASASPTDSLTRLVNELDLYDPQKPNSRGLYKLPLTLLEQVRKDFINAGRVIVHRPQGARTLRGKSVTKRFDCYVDNLEPRYRDVLLLNDLPAAQAKLAITGDPNNTTITGAGLAVREEAKRRHNSYGRIGYKSLEPHQLQETLAWLTAKALTNQPSGPAKKNHIMFPFVLPVALKSDKTLLRAPMIFIVIGNTAEQAYLQTLQRELHSEVPVLERVYQFVRSSMLSCAQSRDSSIITDKESIPTIIRRLIKQTKPNNNNKFIQGRFSWAN